MATETPSVAELDSQSVAPKSENTITLPRKVVYFQAAMLGVIASTFFVFGMMVGTLTSRNNIAPEIVDCTITGKVVFQSQGSWIADPGAVVLIMPANNLPEERMNPKAIHPDSFKATDNPVIDSIQKLGGAVVRTNDSGEFDVVVDSPNKYTVIVVSNLYEENESFTRKEMAAVSSYFMPVESLRDGKGIYVSSIRTDGQSKRLGDIRMK